MDEIRTLPGEGWGIALRRFGEGPTVTLCLHGFLEDGDSFAALAEALPGHCLLAPDMPFHGQSSWSTANPLSPDTLIDALLQCPELQQGPFGLLGYSMGGKVALSIFQRIPDRISHLLLVAPDGLRPSPVDLFFTHTWLGDRILWCSLTNPGWLYPLLTLLRQCKMMNESQHRFVLSYLQDVPMRERVYRIWTTLRYFQPSPRQVQALIRQYPIPVRLIFGRYDRLCPVALGQRFLQPIAGQVELQVFETGHLLLRDKHAQQLAKAFPALPTN